MCNNGQVWASGRTSHEIDTDHFMLRTQLHTFPNSMPNGRMYLGDPAPGAAGLKTSGALRSDPKQRPAACLGRSFARLQARADSCSHRGCVTPEADDFKCSRLRRPGRLEPLYDVRSNCCNSGELHCFNYVFPCRNINAAAANSASPAF